MPRILSGRRHRHLGNSAARETDDRGLSGFLVTYWLARLLVKMEYIGIANIIAGRPIVPELVQSDLSPKRLVQESQAILNDHDARRTMIAKPPRAQRATRCPGRRQSRRRTGRLIDGAVSMTD